MERLMTVVVPIYNSEEFLRECLDSILCQTFQNFELICIDDGSEDSSVEIIKEYMNSDSRITLLKQQHKGAGAARNLGLDNASGQYIIFLDSDDFFDSTMFEKMYNRAVETDADIVMCGCKIYDTKTRIFRNPIAGLQVQLLPKQEVFSKDDIPEHIFQIASGWPWDKLYKLEFIKRKKVFFQEIMVVNDGLFVDIAAAEAERIAVVKEQLVSYRINSGTSITANRFLHWHCIFDMIYEKQVQLRKRGYYELLKQSYINNALELLLVWVEKFNVVEGYQAFFDCLNELIERLEIKDYPKEFYYSEDMYLCIKEIQKSSAVEFWMKRKENNLNTYINYINQMRNNKIWYFPQERFEGGSRFLVYGYGDVGKDFCKQIINSKSMKLVAAIDQKYEMYQDEEIVVIGIDKIYQYTYDYLVIAILDSDVAEKVKKDLLLRNVVEEKIIWIDMN